MSCVQQSIWGFKNGPITVEDRLLKHVEAYGDVEFASLSEDGCKSEMKSRLRGCGEMTGVQGGAWSFGSLSRPRWMA